MENSAAVLEALNPMPIDTNYASGEDLIIRDDIDSILVLCRTLRPFRCKEVCKINTKPSYALIVQNHKLTKYLEETVVWIEISAKVSM